jgi:formylglycine-generating enzyme required for sulfatase activity
MAHHTITINKDSRGREFCFIPITTFQFGLRRSATPVDAAFYIAQQPVTKQEFLEFVDETGYDFPQADRDIMDKLSPLPNCPATPLSWKDAKQFVRWLRKKTGDYYSLPSEHEWEVAARGIDGRMLPWNGNALPTPEQAIYSTDIPRPQTRTVGERPGGESPYGCHDMVGNVWEWTLEGYDDGDEIHLLRGGSCADGPEAATCVARRYVYPAERRVHYAGMRLVWLPQDLLDLYRQGLADAAESAPADKTLILTKRG